MRRIPEAYDRPRLSGERFQARYWLEASEERAARELALELCVEQTVEFPMDLLPSGPIPDEVMGRLEELDPHPRGGFTARISFAVETGVGELPQLLNLLFGNTSLKVGVRLLSLGPGDALARGLPGPRFGRRGLRELLGVPRRPLLCTALKPMGLSPAELARMAAAYARGGVDMIKDDHGLADQPFCRFEERVRRCAEAVANENARGANALYVPNLSGAVHLIAERAALAREAGAGGVMLAPGLVGWDVMRMIAADDTFGLPILAHPALLGSYLASPTSGIAPRALLGQFMRLAGADSVIFPHHGGRFPITEADCRALLRGTEEPLGPTLPLMPMPAGGISLDRLPALRSFYGDDVAFLIGGDLHRAGDLSLSCRRFRDLVEA